jgi:DNA-binding NarL/FixJ family response regulator
VPRSSAARTPSNRNDAWPRSPPAHIHPCLRRAMGLDHHARPVTAQHRLVTRSNRATIAGSFWAAWLSSGCAVNQSVGRAQQHEIEVACLVAAGCSNPEIASRLVISRRAAEHRVQHIHAKVGVSSRAALALFAHEQILSTGVDA